MSLKLATELIEFARANDRLFEWFTPHRYIVSAANPAAEHYGRHSGVTPEWHPEPETLGLRPVGVGIISPSEESGSVHRELTSIYGDKVHLLDFPDVTVAVSPEANKGHAVSLVDKVRWFYEGSTRCQ